MAIVSEKTAPMPIYDFVPAALEPTKPVSNSQEAGALHERLFMLIRLMLKRIEGKGSWTSHSCGYLNQGHALAVAFGSVGTARCTSSNRIQTCTQQRS